VGGFEFDHSDGTPIGLLSYLDEVRWRWRIPMRHSVLHTLLGALMVTSQLACGAATDRPEAGRWATTPGAPSTIVTDWSVKILKYATTSGLPPGHAFRVTALSHLVMHDAVNAIQPRYETFIPEARGPATASLEAAAHAAARGALVRLVPARSAEIDADFAASITAIPDGTSKDQGAAVGDAVADAVLASRSNDGWFASRSYAFRSGPGVYQSTPPNLPALPVLTQLPNATPLFMNSPSQFRPPAPPPLNSQHWKNDLNEVKALGVQDSRNTARTAEQTEIGRFWFENELVSTLRMGRQIAQAKGLNLHDSARIFALTAGAMADGLVACFDGKYAYNFWRPVTAVRAAGIDGNGKTDPDPNWLPDGWAGGGGAGGRFITPAHPEYPSGHAVNGPSGMFVLVALFGDNQELALTSLSLPGVTRHYSKISDAANDIALSRIYVGYHYRTTVMRSLKMGEHVGKWAVHHALRPLGGR
jgi:PAP2 superfamily